MAFRPASYDWANQSAHRGNITNYRSIAQKSENRILSNADRAMLKQLQPQAQGQRLRLFNKRFWDIFSYEKDIPKNLGKLFRKEGYEHSVKEAVAHCRELWDTEIIIQGLPQTIELIRSNPTYMNVISTIHPDLVDEVIQSFRTTKYSIVRYKILSEIIEWLPTNSAKDSFEKMIQLATLDCLEIGMKPPLSSNNVSIMAISSLILTDWEKAMENLGTKGIGFG